VCGSGFAIGVDSAVFWLPLFVDDRSFRIRERIILFFENGAKQTYPPVFFKLFIFKRNSTKTTLEDFTTVWK
jgi:hypothetical protein